MRLDDHLAPRSRHAGSRGDVVVPAGHVPPAGRPWLAPIAVGAVTAAATAVLAVRSPHLTGSYGVCPVLAATGLWCPGCGGLRAVHELTGLDVASAWAMNPLVVVGVPLLVAAWTLWLVRSLGRGPTGTGGRRGRVRHGARTWPGWAFLAVAVAFTVARNVPPLEPWLAPT